MVFSHIARVVASIMLIIGVGMVLGALHITTGALGPPQEAVGIHSITEDKEHGGRDQQCSSASGPC